MTVLDTETTLGGLRSRLEAWRSQYARIALVPTMGALHAGHLALVREAAQRADKVVVSIFVNPAQFAPHEDFDRYPRMPAADAAKLEETDCVDLIYAPTTNIMYPKGFATKIEVGGPSAGLETDFRPHFFAGVATVVAKLLLQCRPDVAVFGEKDYQQLQVVKHLARDLDLAVDIVGVATTREADGLALSSRNAYLSLEERKIAAHLNRILRTAAERARSGYPLADTEAEAIAALIVAGFSRVDYVAIRDAETLQPVRDPQRPGRVLGAAWLGKTRLIDNMAV